MRNQLIYDAPVRVFHWLLAGLFVTAFLIAKTVDDEAAAFSYHMLAGLLLTFTVVLRIVWGFIGTTHSRFSSFALQPRQLLEYFSGILSGDRRKWTGHNPASSWAALAMFGFAIGLGVTGFLMASGSKETYEDLHEIFANGFLIVVLLHVAGVVLHGLRHKDGLALSMVDGKKSGVDAQRTLSRSHGWAAVGILVLIVGFAGYLGRNFDPSTRNLRLFGTVLQLGESESAEGHNQGEGTESEDSNSDDE